MFKRILTSITAFALTACLLCGCSFFVHDTEGDLRQKVAYVKPYTITNVVIDKDENSAEVVYQTQGVTIYKQDLIEYVNSNSSNLSSSFGTDYEGLYRYAVSMLVNIEIIINEVDALIDCGKVEWGVAEHNAIKKSIYGVIDNTLMTTKNDILTGRGQQEIGTDSDDVSTDTTYPVKPEPTDDIGDIDGEITYDEQPWSPDLVKYPGMSGDSDERSLDREAMRRFISLIETRVADDFRIGKDLRAKINNEIKAIDNIIDTKGIEYVYPELGNYPLSDDSDFGYIMYYISGKSIERSQKISSLQKYLTDSVSVSYGEVLDKYNTLKNEQVKLFDEDIATFDSAVSDSGTTVLYYPNNNYFYVKHILLPFSDEQTDALKAFKSRPEIVSLENTEREARIAAYRDRLVNSITCYPHKDGENDLSKPMTVDEVMRHATAVMTPLAGNVKAADEAFTDLIYLYNTDPGAFDNSKGYVVKYKLGDGESESYMQEFADAARIMRDTLGVGQMYGKKVVTDYGVHIMYLASVTQKGTVAINDVTSPATTETYYDVLSEPIRTSRESAAYTSWESNVLSYNYKKFSKLYVDAFSDLWGD